MAVKPTVEVAQVMMGRARAELQRFEKLSVADGFRVEDHLALSRCAWVRAAVLGDLDSVEEVDGRAGDVVLEFQQFTAAVYALQGVMGLADAVFTDLLEAAEAEILPRLECQGLVDGGVATLSSLLSAGVGSDGFLGLRVTSTCLTYDACDPVALPTQLCDDDRVHTFPVYPRELYEAVQGGAATDEYVRLKRDESTDAWVLDVSGQSYCLSHLPYGQYALRVGASRTVTPAVFRRVLANTVELPGLMKSLGYCYLAAVPMVMRVAVAHTLKAFPTVGELRRVLPRSGQWCSRSVGVVDRGKYKHFTGTGFVPLTLPDSVRVGAGPVDDEVDRELRGALTRLDHLMRDKVVRRDSVVSGFVPTAVLGGDASFSLSVDSKPKAVGFAGVDAVADLPMASELFQPTTKHVERDRVLGTRLDSGGPLSDRYWRKVQNRYGIGRYLPAPRFEHGRVVLLPQGFEGPASTTGEWQAMDVVTGWQVNRMSLRSVKPVSKFDVVVGKAAAARLDCSAHSDLVVDNLRVPGQATVVWFQTHVSFVTTAPGGSVSSAVPFSGSAIGPGWLPSTAVAMYGCPYIKDLDDHVVASDNVVTLYDKQTKSGFGLVRTGGQVNVRTVGYVPLKIVSNEGREGMAMMIFSGSGLRALRVGGVQVPARDGVVRVVAERWSTSVELVVTAPGKFKVLADFVADPPSLEAKLRHSPVSPVSVGLGFE